MEVNVIVLNKRRLGLQHDRNYWSKH